MKQLDSFSGSSYANSGTPYDVCQVLKHPCYDNAEKDYYYDVGLLLLTNKIKLTSKVQVATIAPFNKWRHVRYSMTIAGFGQTGVSNENIKGFPKEDAVMRAY